MYAFARALSYAAIAMLPACDGATSPGSPENPSILLSANVDAGSIVGLLNADGTEYQQLVASNGHVTAIAWAPGYRRFAFAVATDSLELEPTVYTASRDGTDLAQIFRSTLGPITRLGWSPDGRYIRFNGLCGLYEIRADGTRLDTLVVGDRLACLWQIAWAPDGRRVAVAESGGLYLMHIDGSGRQLIAPASEERPAWSPDGFRLAFVSQKAGISIIDTTGSNERRLTDDTGFLDYAPAWSPDGQRVAFLRYSFPPRLLVIDAAGGSAVALGSPPGWVTLIAW